MKTFYRLGLAFLFLLTIWLVPGSRAAAQDDIETTDYSAQARALLDEMSVDERVGQLFLVTFDGADTSTEASINLLISQYRIGGVVLLAENDNVQGENGSTPQQVADLTNRLQQLSLQPNTVITAPVDNEDEAGQQVEANGEDQGTAIGMPLFIATLQEGDGAPFSQIRDGVTELPSPMAIGATWQPQVAREVGQIVGQELGALGVNMVLGPSLDVLERPNPTSASDLGIRTFGGDPYWVGLMGSAYTQGVHQGSDGRIAVITKHFPGRGSSDRPLDEEVSTVRKSLEQLKQVELAPFFATTGLAPNPEATADGMLVTHIRYQGFQGNLRDTTAPVSFDPPALQTLMALPELSGWRERGGILVSDALGVRAVQRFYDNTGTEFPHRQVAKDALLAGNDLLYIDQFALAQNDFNSQVANLIDTITWFQERYLTDPAFQQRIDEAVLRILELKLRLYEGDFAAENILVDTSRLPELLQQHRGTILSLAQSAATLISPGQTELQDRLPRPPGPEDQIVVFTDVRQSQQCTECPPEPYISLTGLEERIMALYGPEGSGQVREGQVRSFSYGDLNAFLDAGPGPIPPPTPEAGDGVPVEGDPSATPEYSPAFQVQSALQNAEWVIFAALDVTPNVPHSQALKRFLAERSDLIRNTRSIVFAYNAPYYLDTTEISKLTAYYALYSKQPAFIDTAVRLLFQEASVRGAPPVDIAGIDYNLFGATQPASNQVIDLFVVRDGALQSPASDEPLELVVGESLRLRTGVIRDHNGHPVPDGTPVQFIQQDRLQGFTSVIGERPTVNGVAELDYVLEARTGQFRITAVSGEARNSQQIDVAIGDNIRIVVMTVTPGPTAAPTLTPTSTATLEPSSTPTNTPTATLAPAPTPTEPRVEIPLEALFMLLSLGGGLLLTTFLVAFAVQAQMVTNSHQLIRLLMLGVIGNLIFYNYFALGLPGAEWLSAAGSWAALLATVAGGLLGLAIGWWQVGNRPTAERQSQSAGD